MKLNYLGIVGGILAFISIGGSWWTMTLMIKISATEVNVVSGDLFLYEARTGGLPAGLPIELGWFSWAALALVIIGGILGIAGSLWIVERVTKFSKKLLLGSGALALLSMVIFAVGLQMLLSTVPGFGLFSDGSFLGNSYSTGLSIGFWLALVAAIITFAASRKTPE